jgi:hypothetical protein
MERGKEGEEKRAKKTFPSKHLMLSFLLCFENFSFLLIPLIVFLFLTPVAQRKHKAHNGQF